MPEIIKPGDDIKGLEHQAHPVMRVYCDTEGIICYERDGADPVRLNQVSPESSRRSAVQRCRALLDMQATKKITSAHDIDLNAIEFMMPISPTGLGLTFRQLAQQTLEAMEKSKMVEVERTAMFEAKKKKYKLN